MIYLNPLNNKALEPILLTDYTTLGRAPDCTKTLRHDSIAERHVRIEKKAEIFQVKDMRTTTGTYLNDAKIIEAEINVGDILRIGPFEFQVCKSKTNETNLLSSNLQSKNEIWNRELASLSHVAKTQFPILLLGPSGTGKDVLAQEIHKGSPRSEEPFVSVNCSALTETLVESELFGHIKGSFTGAVVDRKGAFESARGGTLFLDEIGDLPYSLQAKLLRALENNEIRPVGSDKVIKTDVRIIAATHQNLTEKIQTGLFRSDLYFRLNVIQISPPPLNQRMEDFEDLLMIFARQFKVRFSMPAISKLKKYPWPGNIRELKNTVARAKALFPDEYIEDLHVDQLLGRTLDRTLLQGPALSTSHLPVIKEIEKQMIIKRLIANKGNQRQTAHDLGLPKSTLHDRLKHFNIDIKNYRA